MNLFNDDGIGFLTEERFIEVCNKDVIIRAQHFGTSNGYYYNGYDYVQFAPNGDLMTMTITINIEQNIKIQFDNWSTKGLRVRANSRNAMWVIVESEEEHFFKSTMYDLPSWDVCNAFNQFVKRVHDKIVEFNIWVKP